MKLMEARDCTNDSPWRQGVSGDAESIGHLGSVAVRGLKNLNDRCQPNPAVRARLQQQFV